MDICIHFYLLVFFIKKKIWTKICPKMSNSDFYVYNNCTYFIYHIQ